MIYKEEMKLNVQVCIVGSGIGGGTVALKLAEQGISFVIVEAGGTAPRKTNVKVDNVGRPFGLRTTAAIQLGGTSNLWHGVLAPLDKNDFEQREWIPNSGWPISLSDLKPFYRESSEILGIKDYDFFNPEKLSKELMVNLNDMKFNRRILKNKLFQQPLPPKNFKHDLLELVKKSKDFHLYMDTTALEFDIGPCNNVKRLICGLEDGETFEVTANTYVVCAGALETPRLLLNSKVDNVNLGKYLMDHPMTSLCQIEPKNTQKTHIYSAVKYRTDVAIKTGFELKCEEQISRKVPNHTFFMRPSFRRGINNAVEKVKLSLLTFKDGGVSFKDIFKVLSSIDIIFQVLLYKFSLSTNYKYMDLFFVTEQVPLAENKVSLSHVVDKWGYPISQVNWEMSQLDIDFMAEWYKVLTRECLADYYLTAEFSPFDWKNSYTSAAHHLGTARMNTVKETGVIDKNLKVFDVNNLYVCDGSVFTTSGNVNPGLTISAFSCRLVKYLTDKKILKGRHSD